jgi:hypothetical protein
MDEKELLTRLVTLQEDQNHLLRTNLTRIKFSLWSLFLMMTGLCILFAAFAIRSTRRIPTSIPSPVIVTNPPNQPNRVLPRASPNPVWPELK